MPKIFISYTNADRQLAQDLAAGLQERGHEPLFAEGLLSPGQAWRDVLAKNLGDADAFVILISPRAATSQWVFTEAGTALGYWRERGRPIVLPVVIEDAEIPAPLREIQAIFSLEPNVPQIIRQIELALGKQAGAREAKEEVRREVQQRVERNAAVFIAKSLDELRKRERDHRRSAYLAYSISYVFLIGGIGFALYRAILYPALGNWPAFAQLLALSIIIVGFLVAAAKLSFLLGQGFMVESLRSADRIHAISFGEFYLNAFGEQADWSQIKEAFQNWNIDRGSSFPSQNAKDIDPQILELAIELAKSVSAKSNKKE